MLAVGFSMWLQQQFSLGAEYIYLGGTGPGFVIGRCQSDETHAAPLVVFVVLIFGEAHAWQAVRITAWVYASIW